VNNESILLDALFFGMPFAEMGLERPFRKLELSRSEGFFWRIEDPETARVSGSLNTL